MSDVQPPNDPQYGADAGSGYGTGGLPRHPGTPPPAPGRLDAQVPQPPAIRTAVRLMVVGAGISVVGLIVTLATVDSLKPRIRDQLAKSNTNVTTDTVNTAYDFAIVVGVVFAVIGILLWLWMAWKNGEGRRWARIVATVLGGFNIFSTLYTISAGTSTAGGSILTVINVVLAIVILVLLWRKEASAYYAERRRPQYG